MLAYAVICLHRIHTALETGPDTVVKTSLDSLRLNPRLFESVENLLRDFLAADIRIRLLVIVAREAIETR